MAAGVPVVATAVGGVPELGLGPGRPACSSSLVDPISWRAALAELLAEPVRAQALGLGGKGARRSTLLPRADGCDHLGDVRGDRLCLEALRPPLLRGGHSGGSVHRRGTPTDLMGVSPATHPNRHPVASCLCARRLGWGRKYWPSHLPRKPRRRSRRRPAHSGSAPAGRPRPLGRVALRLCRAPHMAVGAVRWLKADNEHQSPWCTRTRR